MNDLVIIRLDSANRALSEAKTIQDTKKIVDIAHAAEIYAKRQKLGDEAISYALAIKVRALAHLGALLKDTPKNEGAKGILPITGSHRVPVMDSTPTLAQRGISKKISSIAQKLASLPPEELAEVEAGHTAMTAAIKEARREEKAEAKRATPEALPSISDRYTLICDDLKNADVADESVDWIITDPPYPKEFLPVYDDLGAFAARVLKPGGSLVCMIGQSYLPEILKALSGYLTYHWIAAYLTPGSSTQVWQRRVNTNWKPLLWFTRGEFKGEFSGDVCQSTSQDKEHHHWGQSESGMASIIERFTFPGQTICDPFCGAGTTGVVAVTMNRLFVGIDIDPAAIEKSVGRLNSCGVVA
jgi:site-specific DNA-methyltransferase (adenine-specific)